MVTMKQVKRWPYRQHDPRWKSVVMWDRDTVMKVGRKYHGLSKIRAGDLLWKYQGGNTIGNEGCLLTCLSMVLHMLNKGNGIWTPDRLNDFAQEYLYYTPSGFSATTLYADLVGEASNGQVQLLLKEEYHSGTTRYPKVFCSRCMPVQAYLSLPESVKLQCSVMIKTGTYDDTFASHFILVDPGAESGEDDIAILDPIQPLNSKAGIWTLSNSSKKLCEDKDVKSEWAALNIAPLQIAGVWVFCTWRPETEAVLGQSFIEALSRSVTRTTR